MQAFLRSKQKTFSLFYVLVIYLAIFAQSAWAKPGYIVAPYLETSSSGTITPAGIPWNDITHLYLAFGGVNTASPFATFTMPGAWSTLVSTAHSNNTRVVISFGGAGVDDNGWVTPTNATNLNTFVTQIMNIVSTNNFDGVDIDWEFPDEQTSDGTQFTNLMEALATQLHAQNAYDGNPMSLSFYISPGSQICGVNWGTVVNYADYGIQGGYDYDVSTGGTTYNGPVSLPNTAGVSFTDCYGTQRPLDSSSNIADIVGRGWAWNKTVLGCPLYIENGGQTNVNTVIAGGTLVSAANGVEMESVYTYGGSNYGVNDRNAFCNKINWALSKGMLGISMWQMGGAYPNTGASASIWNVAGGNDSCLNLPTATNTPTLTFTNTTTSTPTNTFTSTITNTSTQTSTPTNTITNTVTNTFTPGGNTNTPTNSSTPSGTFTSTFTSTITLTATNTPVDTNTPSSTATASFTSTPSFTSTSTNIFTATLTATATATNTPSHGYPVVYPNPVSGPTVSVQVPLKSPGDVTIKIFTLAFRQVAVQTQSQASVGVDITVPLVDKSGISLANGLYYFVIETYGQRWVNKVLVLR